MLPASARVRRRVEFSAALRGSRVRSDGLVLHYGVQPDGDLIDPRPKAGVIVSRAVGGAVVRNQVRRRIRHLLVRVLPALPPGGVLVVRALPVAASRSSEQLLDALAAGCARLRLPFVAS